MTKVFVWAAMRFDWVVTAASNSPRKAARSRFSEASNRWSSPSNLCSTAWNL
jgi:hypothetical protein